MKLQTTIEFTSFFNGRLRNDYMVIDEFMAKDLRQSKRSRARIFNGLL